ncbi:VRR-NUC domain-containing protein [Pedobacter sp. P351]|uniref:VRR-NUC domain-containing protein n=1 Tax=Pedobacter superstes TaxID=3133441 RepID=UPI0030A202FA
MIEKCPVKHHSFIKWSGLPLRNTYGGKPVIDYKGQPLFAELVALQIYKELGYDGVWVDTYSKKYRIGLLDDTDPVQLPNEINAKLQDIITVNKSSKGVWDLLLWKDGDLKFVELKRKGKDSIRPTQIQFLDSALRCGYQVQHFEIIEWELTSPMNSLEKIAAILKTGEERLKYNGVNTKYALLDFWKWSVSDILSNATRGRFAEFIVATACNIDIRQIRDEWSAYDLETSDGIKIEVKSAAYIQSWFQSSLSKISFSTKASLAWDSLTNIQSTVKSRSADVYVFCLLHHDIKHTVDPLDLNHWEFYVLSTAELNNYTRSQHSISLKSLRGLTSAIQYDQLDGEIKSKYARYNRMDET